MNLANNKIHIFVNVMSFFFPFVYIEKAGGGSENTGGGKGELGFGKQQGVGRSRSGGLIPESESKTEFGIG